MSDSSGTITVLHIDDEPGFAELTSTFLERESERFTVETTTDPAGALATLDTSEIDCVVSDYDMPGMNGLELLETVRERYPDLPFILFTGKGSEAVASDAISAGVTDYLQKGSRSGQYELLANRIENAVEATRARRERRRNLDAIETAQEGIAILDDGRFVYVNEAYADLYGYDPDGMLGEHWKLIYPDGDVRRAREEILPEVRETGYWHGTTTGLRADGSTFVEDHVLATSDRDELICTVRDITERKTRQTRLKETLTKFEALFENSPDMIATHDADGRILDVNRRLADSLGYSNEELVGTNVWDIDPTVEPAEASAFWAELPPDDVRTFEGKYRRRDGSTFPVEIHLVRIEIDGADRFLSISHDITDRRDRETQLQRQNDRLSQFASVVSHDLRNPLNVASGRLELAREDRDGEHLDAIGDAHDRMRTLIDDLLELAREGEAVTDREPVDLPTIVEDCWATVETAGVSLAIEADRTVSADRSRLKQVFENLIHNAVEHSSTSPRSQAPEESAERDDRTITVGTLPDGFYVADDGPGIPESDREAVFEVGYSTGADGTGFGLSIVERVVEAHGWEIAVTESDAGGARFEITGVEFVTPTETAASGGSDER